MGDDTHAYALDASRWPLLTVRATAHVHDLSALERTYHALEQALARRQRFLILFDMRGGASDPQRRKRFAAWVTQHRTSVERFTIASAIIVGTSVERGFVTAAMWLVATPCPVRVFTSPSEAEAWLWAMQAQEGAARSTG